MIQLIASRPLSSAEAARSWRLSDPDLLLEIANRFKRRGAAEAELSRAFSLILHDIRMGGTWKRTNRGRLPLAERMICVHVPPHEVVTVLDLGASDGITTLDLAIALRARFGERGRLLLADLNLWLLRYRFGPVVEYRSPGDEPVMARVGRIGLRLSNNRGATRPGALARIYLSCGPLRRAMRLTERISLVHPLAAQDQAIVPMELDCLTQDPSLVGQLSAIRASNVLNRGYFTPAQLRTAIGNLHAYLREEGCLVVSRNEDAAAGECENGSVWRKAGGGFVHLADFGAGSEIKSVVDRWPHA